MIEKPPLIPDELPAPYVEGREDWIATHDLAWRLAYDHIGHDPGLTAPWFMDEGCMPDRLWQWDTCFMALYTAYAPHVFPGIQSLDNFYGWQRADGFIAYCTFLATGEPAYGERINPPLFAWIEWEQYRHTGDASRFARVLPHLVRYFDWIKIHRRRPRIVDPSEELQPSDITADSAGLYWETCGGAMGMDNSPRTVHHSWTGGELAWIDLSAQQALAARYLQRIAEHLGDQTTAARFAAEHAGLTRLINRWMWCERDGFYHDIFLDGNFLSVRTIAGFWPLLAGIATPERARALVAKLQDPAEFNRPHPVPSLSASDPNYVPSGGYWLGGVWAPTNYMVVRGLAEYGFDAVAHDIAVRHLDGIVATRRSTQPDTIWEAYAPDAFSPATRKDKRSWVRKDFCGWSALGAISMLYENILGVRRDVPERTLIWDIRLDRRHGFHRYPLAGATVALRFDGRAVEVTSPVAFKLRWQRNGRHGDVAIQPGTTKIKVGEHD